MIGRLALIFVLAAGSASAAPDWSDIGALFANRCTKCHAGYDAPLGLSLDSFQGALSGSWTGRVLIPGDVQGSPLMARIRGEAVPRMPLDGPPFLTDDDIANVAAWIEAGLPEGSPGAVVSAPQPQRPQPGEPVLFGDVEPIFLKSCIKCHSDNSKLSAPPEGLRLDRLENILRGGDRLVVLPGNPEMSEIWRRITGVSLPRMPHDGPPWLGEDDVRLIRDWIAQGAPDNEGNMAPVPAGGKVRLRGILTAPDAIDGARFIVGPRTRLDDAPGKGFSAEMRGEVQPDGSVLGLRLRSR